MKAGLWKKRGLETSVLARRRSEDADGCKQRRLFSAWSSHLQFGESLKSTFRE